LTMGEHVVCGVDAHEKWLDCRIGVDREAPGRRRYENNREGRGEMFEQLELLAEEHGGAKVMVGYEASLLGFGLYDDCREHGFECAVLAPTKIARSVEDRKRKTDDRDATRIFEALRAHVLAGNALPAIWIPDVETRDDREMLRARLDLSEKLSRVKTQVRMLLKRNGVEKPKEVGARWTIPFRAWVAALELKPGAQSCLSSLLRQVKFLEEEIKPLDRQVLELSQTARYREPSEALCRIGGVGLFTAMVYLTEMGDLSRFRNRKKIGAFLGLVPSSDESGESGDRKGHITHQGPRRVRKVLCQGVWARIHTDREEAEVYRRMVERNPKRKKIAVVGCMRRLAILMWYVGLEAQKRARCFVTEVPAELRA